MTCSWKRGFTIAVCLLVPVGHLYAAQLIKDGKALAVLVTPDKPTAEVRSAAELLQQTLEKMSGARLAIVSESAGSGSLVPIHVGHTAFAQQKGIRLSALKAEEIVLHATDRYVIVCGNDGPAGPEAKQRQNGTYFAAVELLHRLGVRWLWPDPSGEVIPSGGSVTLANVEYRHAPKVFDRGMRLRAQAGHWRMSTDKFGEGIQHYELNDWPERARLGASRAIKAGHAYSTWYERFFKTHPDWFARGGDDGKNGEDDEFVRAHPERFAPGGANYKTFGWLINPDRSKLCNSNPGAIAQLVSEAKAYYQRCANPELSSFSLSPNDGRAGFCMCPDCRAWDNPNGPPAVWTFAAPQPGGGFKRSIVQDVSLTDRHARSWNAIAGQLAKDCPGLVLGAMAYSVYRAPPVEVKLLPNIAVGYVGGSYVNEKARESLMRDWQLWSEKCSQMYWRPNLMKEGEGFPLVWATRMGHDLKTLIAQGMVSYDMPNVHHHWGTQGLNYYMLAHISWDETQDPKAIVDDWCTRGFGAAAPTVRRYIARLEDLTEKFAVQEGLRSPSDVDAILQRLDNVVDEKPVTAPRSTLPSGWHVVWTDQAMAGLQQLLDAAAKAVPAQSVEARRVAILREGFEFARLELPVRRATEDYIDRPSPENDYKFTHAVARVEQWMYAHQDSKAIGVVEGYSWWWRKMRIDPITKGRIFGRATKLTDGNYTLTIPAYNETGKFAAIQFSRDGKTWSPEEHYTLEHRWKSDGGDTAVYARLVLTNSKGRKMMEPIKISLQ